MTETKVNPDPRDEYIAGLRMLADLLEAHPELMLPYDGGDGSPLCIIPIGRARQREQLTAWAKALPGRKEKKPRGDAFDLTGTVRGVHIKVICNRDNVCEKVVLGTETVTETVPDPEYMAAAPLVERETEREIVKWVCAPSILAEDEPVGAAS